MQEHKKNIELHNQQVMEKNRIGRSYILFILFIVYAFNFIDRQILVILSEPIKKDLGLSDSQLGLLTGFSFAIFYVTAGIPLARLADRSNRRNIIASCLTIWSGMTAVSAYVGNYFQLVLARIGVGIGEAGCSPPAHSMISDMYESKERATALSLYSMGIYLGVLLGFLIGGYVASEYGWRMTFLIVGLPGILLALLMFLTVREPLRRQNEKSSAAEKSSMIDSFKLLWQKTSFRYFSVACAMAAFVAYGIINFAPSHFDRTHEMDIADVGFWLSMINGIGGMAGTFIGGYLTDKLGQKDKRWYLWVPALGALISFPFFFTAFYTLDTSLMLTSLSIGVVFSTFYLGPSIACAHMIVPPAQRAMASAILFFILNLIGLGLGPLMVGIISDSLATDYGDALALQYALIAVTFVLLIKFALYFLGARSLKKDILE